ncbi:LLM class F420-dependent oxidoreductase [Gordonia alkanivorans]|uniref:LLM class F420-dependent oxidoreductase n=1 Tax=Gordonia alkanivorans TaxID=84096 RepID=UPI00244CC560|nr:LLM class F420-dependent oxidoreductase [Gordonia alkanivorans]MDH3022810.1 LLM class F420-dependent oxidoreductase [Gordonia alkanivorans]
MRLGITSPVLVQHPSTRSDWEQAATIDDVARIARRADDLGFNHITCSEHIAVPVEVAEVRGGTYWDPLATFGYLAAATNRLHLVTNVLVLGYHHPLEIAKRYGTLDRVSRGRLVLGVGVGTLKEEFDLIGAPFDDRGARADDAIAALRASLSTARPEYHGRFYDYADLVVEPHAVQDHVPIWVGGRTRRSLRRACAHGDGWAPFGLGSDQLRTMLADAPIPPSFDVVLSSPRALDPLGAPDTVTRTLNDLRDAGATIAGASLAARDAGHYVDQLEELHRLAHLEGVDFAGRVVPPGPDTGHEQESRT